jgi:peptidoglycan/xylan/chitin deacetylase (PgdA/CDA1 family)
MPVKKIATSLSLLGLFSAAGCSATQSAPPVISATNVDTAIFQQGMADVSGPNVGLIGTNSIALTFDDGPQRGSTDELLDFLKAEDIKATFFMVGKNIPGNEDLLERMKDDGMSLGNHTFDHTPIVKMSKTNMNGVYQEIIKDDALITPHLADGKHIFFRSPGGSWTKLIADAMNQHPNIAQKYIGPVFWDIGGTTYFADSNGHKLAGEAVHYDADNGLVTMVSRGAGGAIIKKWTARSTSLYAAADWDCSVPAMNIPVEMCAEGYMKEIARRGGGIVLVHDTHPKTIQMVKLMIPRLKTQGFKFITLDQLPNIQKFE